MEAMRHPTSKAKPRWPNGMPVAVCRPCRLFHKPTAKHCVECKAPTVETLIYNQPDS